ncbi:HEXXH motif-containing putative peptide modification protein [Streptomyces lavendulae]|uniref:aKG-HExxH-type peptide beta-hydroxylase n=1 Tax=Streptomyces lavendulae TaxID=1914 RepID=UPI0036C7A1CA
MHLLNLGHMYESAARFVQAVNGEYADDATALRPAYVTAINTIRPSNLPGRLDGIRVSYEDGGWAEHCRVNDVFGHIVGPATQSDGPTREGWDREINAALNLISEIHPDLRRLVDLLVTDVVVFNSGVDGGGSANKMPGVVLMSPGPTWTTLNYAQCLVHEGLHSGLFVLDVVNRMFTLPPLELEKDEYRALSAVKIGQKRPLHAAFHAAAVALPLMLMEDHQGVDDLVSKYTESLREACEDMQTKREFFTPYGQLLLDEMTAWAARPPLDFEHLAYSISDPKYAGYTPAA